MEKLNELVSHAQIADAESMKMYGVEPNDVFAIWQAFRSLEKRAEAAEAKLADLEKQKPIGRVDRGAVTDSNEYPDARVVCLHEHVGWEAFQDGCELFTRPAPAFGLEELVPDEIESASGSDFDDYYCDGFNACRAAMLRKIEEEIRDN